MTVFQIIPQLSQINNNINMQSFPISLSISSIYPDIEEELCSKHTIHLNNLAKKYNKAYPMNPISKFIIAKKQANIVRGTKSVMKMAMEQGTVILMSEGSEDNNLCVSGNHFEEVVISKAGKIINAEHEIQMTKIISKAAELATEDLSLNKLKGGFMHLHFERNETMHEMRNSILIGLFLAFLTINQVLEEYTVEQLVTKLKSLVEFQDNNIAEDYFFNHSNRELLLQDSQSTIGVSLDNKYKLVFMNISFLESTFPSIEVNPQSVEDTLDILKNQQINFVEMMNRIAALQMTTIQGTKVQTFVSDIINSFKITGFIFSGQYCIFAVENYRYAEVIGHISRMINKVLSEKKQSTEQPQLVVRQTSKSQIPSILFSSVPSPAVSILDPSESIWF